MSEQMDDETFCAHLEGLGLLGSAQAIRRGESSRSAVIASLESSVKLKRSFLDSREPFGSGAMHDRVKAWCAHAEELIERSGTGKKRGGR